MSGQAEQLALFCGRCGGTGRLQGAAVTATGRRRGPIGVPERRYDCYPFEADCPECGPSARQRWLEAVDLGRRG